MADNQGNLTDETSDEISMSYRILNFPNEADAGEEDNEDVVEYLDIDLENTTSVRDTEEECSSRVSSATPRNARRSILKKNCGIPPKHSNNPKRKSILGKSTKNEKTSQSSTASSMEHDVNSAKRSKRKATLESASVHAAVDEINAKLAASANFVNADHRVSNNNTERSTVLDSPVKFETDEPDKPPDLDSLDLFFQSMAHTVTTLPAAVQAKIKMDICKVIATAEMKYSTLDTSLEFDQHL